MGQYIEVMYGRKNHVYGPETDTSKMTKAQLKTFQATMRQHQKWNKDAAKR